MPAAVGRKIKYRFHAWQAPEVFSKRQPLIFSHYLCHCGSFFPHVCVAFMCVPRQYSCLRPSGRCRVKRPFSTTFSSHFHNGSISRDSVPLRHGFFRCPLAAGLLCGLTPPSRFHNGSVFRDSVPLRHGFHRGILSTGLLRGIALPSRFHNGSVFRDSVPLRHVHFRLRPCCRSSARHCPSVPFPQRQQIPQFSAVAESYSGRSPATDSLDDIVYQNSFHNSIFPFLSYSLTLLFTSILFSTFQRCVGFPRFRLTFRRCAESSQLRERPASVFLLLLCISHLRKVCSFPAFSSHFPKVC